MTHANLLEARRMLGLTQARLAALLRRSRVTVNRWERGHDPIPHWVDVILTREVLRQGMQVTSWERAA